MDLSKEMTDLLLEQVGHELFNSSLYTQIEGYFEGRNLFGFSEFFKEQGGENGERLHARKIIDYINDRNGKFDMPPIEKPNVTFNSLIEVMEAYLNQERSTTERLYNIFTTARATNDYTTEQFLVWFLNEQVEEEKLALQMLDNAKFINEDPTAILLWNNELKEG